MSVPACSSDNSTEACRRAMAQVPHLDSYDLRQLIAASIGALSSQMGGAHTAKILSNVMDAARRTSGNMSLHEVAFQIGQKHDVAVADLRRPDDGHGARTPRLVHARQEAFWLARQQRRASGKCAGHAQHSYPQIGKFFGGRDHTTVLHGKRQHEKRMLLERDQ